MKSKIRLSIKLLASVLLTVSLIPMVIAQSTQEVPLNNLLKQQNKNANPMVKPTVNPVVTAPVIAPQSSTQPVVQPPHSVTSQETTQAQQQKQSKSLWNLKNVDIRTVIHAVAKETNKNFVIDPRVTGKVTLISSQPLKSDELYAVFLSVLQVNGFAALPEGNVIKIVPDYVARGLSSPIYNESMRKEGDAMAVSVVGIKYVPVNELSGALNQFLTPSGHIAAYTPSNDLIIADRAENIVHLMQLISQIDQQRASKIEVIHLHNAQAKTLVATLKLMLGQKGAGTAAAAQSGLIELSMAADERTNSVLLSGGSPEQRLQLRSVITHLDVSSSLPGSVTEVIYLKHLYAERTAPLVNSLIQNFIEKTRQATPGQIQPAQAGQQSSYTSSSESSNDQAGSSLFSTTMSGNSNSGTGGYGGGSISSPNIQNNDISNIVNKLPKSGSVSPYVQWEESTNALIVTAPKEVMRKVKKVIAKLDIRRPQVLIEAVVAEVSEVRQKELGIQLNPNGSVVFKTSFLPELPLSIIGADGNLATTAAADTAGQGVSSFYKNSQIRILIAALETDTDSNILATPNLVTLDNEPAQIKVGSKVPFSIGQIQNNPTGGNPYSFFDREDVGLVLTIDPHITPNGSIKLLIQQELSAIVPGSANSNTGGNPTTTERFIRTTVMADNGNILVLGGLLENQWSQTTSKVPWLGNLPVIGVFFRDKAKTINKTNLMIFLRPTILYNDRDDKRVSGGKYEYLRQNESKLDIQNAFRHHYDTPVLPVEGKVTLPPPFPKFTASAP